MPEALARALGGPASRLVLGPSIRTAALLLVLAAVIWSAAATVVATKCAVTSFDKSRNGQPRSDQSAEG